MCGRFVSASPAGTIASAFGATVSDLSLPPRYNVAPSAAVWAVRELVGGPNGDEQAESQRRLSVLRWGLVPSWADDVTMGARMINARVETVAEKPSFRRAAARRRCLVPVDGFFEWRREDGKRLPWYFTSPDESLLAFAGLWERWNPSGHRGEPLETCTILTTAAVGDIASVHHRMPVVLDASVWDRWLDPQWTDGCGAAELVVSLPPPTLVGWRVGTQVNNARNDGVGLIAPLGSPESGGWQ